MLLRQRKHPGGASGGPVAGGVPPVRPSAARGSPLVSRERVVVPPERHLPPEVTDAAVLNAVQGKRQLLA